MAIPSPHFFLLCLGIGIQRLALSENSLAPAGFLSHPLQLPMSKFSLSTKSWQNGQKKVDKKKDCTKERVCAPRNDGMEKRKKVPMPRRKATKMKGSGIGG
jgi:hypothetical protein